MQGQIAHLIAYNPPPPGKYDYTLDLLRTLLDHAGLALDEMYLVRWTTPEEVAARLEEIKPNVVVVWEHYGQIVKALAGGQKRNLDDWAGYVWLADAVCPGVKVIATYAPARVKVEWGLTGVIKFHLLKALKESRTRELVVPERRVEILWPQGGWNAGEVVVYLNNLQAAGKPLAHDIEGGCGMGPACYGFADSPSHAVVVPIYDVDGVSIWSEEDEILITQAVLELLESPQVPKIIQNALYESFCEAWTTGIVIQGLQDDTMLKQWELYPELDKSLEFQAMLHTNQPYWKLEHREVGGRYVPFRNGRRVTTEEWFIYNGTDCCVTYEVNEVMERQLMPRQREHYRWMVRLLTPMAYMQLRGIRYDKGLAKARLKETQERIYELQDEINQEAAKSPDRLRLREFYEALLAPQETPVVALVPLLTTAFCKARRLEERTVTETSWQPVRWRKSKKSGKWVKAGKRVAEQPDGSFRTTVQHESEWNEGDLAYQQVDKQVTRNFPVAIQTLEDVLRYCKDSCLPACRRCLGILGEATTGTGLGATQRGELATLLNLSVNINSTNAGGDAQWFLYTHCGLPKQYRKEGGKLTDKLTTDDDALITIYTKTQDPRALLCLHMRQAQTRTNYLKGDADSDGRMRYGLNLVGTPTGRMAAYGSPTGSSDINPQTWTKDLRDMMLADPGCHLGQRDLAGADGYTVAAYAAMMGDSTMLDDLKAGLKVAKIIALMVRHGAVVNTWPRERLKEEGKSVTEEAGAEYPIAKVIQHMSSYKGGAAKMAESILINSVKKGKGKPIVVAAVKCKQIQEECFFTRYPGIKRWHQWMGVTLSTTGELLASNGFKRKFHGRKDEHSTLKEALAHMPQVYTTYSILSTLISMNGAPRQWDDPENRRDDGSLRVEPLLLVHDSNVSQWRKEDLEFARVKLSAWFLNEINVAGQVLTIPASGSYGENWGKQIENL